MTREELANPDQREVAQLSKLLLTVPEAARALGVSRSKVYDLIARRSLRSLRLDGCRRVPVEALETYIAGLMAEQQEEVFFYGTAP